MTGWITALFGQKETKMAFPKDTRVTVDSVNDTYINISIGPNGYQIDKGELAQLMSGQMDDIETIKRNMAGEIVESVQTERDA